MHLIVAVCQMLICFVSLQSQLISWPLLQKTNDVSNAKSLCRLAWQPGTAKVSHPLRPAATIISAFFTSSVQPTSVINHWIWWYYNNRQIFHLKNPLFVFSFWRFLWSRRCSCTSEGPGIMWALCLMICWLRWGPGVECATAKKHVNMFIFQNVIFLQINNLSGRFMSDLFSIYIV